MTALAQLKLVSTRKPQHQPAALQRRNKLSARLWEQIQLAQAQQAGTQFHTQRLRAYKDADTGIRKHIEVPKRVRPWWFTADNGKTAVSVRYGARVLELAKGKWAVEVASAADLVPTLQAIKSAVDAGELDAQIEAAAGSLRAGFEK
jgi:hypothetical protein